MPDSFVADPEQDSFVEDSFTPDTLPRGLSGPTTISARKKLSFQDFFPLTTKAAQLGTKLPGLYGATASTDLMNVLGAPLNIIADVAGRIGSGRPQQSLANTIQTGLHGGEQTLENGQPSRTDPVIKMILGGLLGMNAPGVQQVGLDVATGLEETLALPGLPSYSLGRAGTIAKPNLAREQLLTDVREGFLQAPKLAGKEFETQLDELVGKFPDKRVNLRPALERAQKLAEQNPAVGNLISRASLNSKESGLVQSLLKNPEAAENLTLKSSQTVKRVFQQLLKAKFGQIAPELFDAHLDVLDVWHSVREAQLSAFPEFQDVMGGYRKVLDNFRSIKPSLSKGGLEKSVLENFGGTERARAVRELLPQETIDLIKRLQSSTSFRKWATRLGIAGTVGAGAAIGGTVAKGLLKPTLDYAVTQ